MQIKNLEDLRKIKAESQKATETRKQNDTQIIIGMGTCGIAAGAREVMKAVLDELAKRKINNVSVLQTGCIGMACPGGCIGGGGQPTPVNMEIRKARTEAIYSIDEASTYRQSHKNPDIIALYDKWLKEPLSETAHHYLHTHYAAQSREA